MFGKFLSGRNSQKGQGPSKKIEDNLLSAAALANADEMIQDKIINYFISNQSPEALTASNPAITPEQREQISQALASGTISATQINQLLQHIPTPLQDGNATPAQIFQQITSEPREKQILAVATGHNANNWQTVSVADLEHLLAKPLKDQPDYRTPLDFAKFRTKFIDGIKDQATNAQLQSYQRAMDSLENKLYGQQFAYYQQLQLLSNNTDAAEAPTPDTTSPDEAALTEIINEERQATPTEPTPTQPSSTDIPGVTLIGTERSNEILNHAIINGDPWLQGGTEYRLGITNLLASGLVPTYEFVLENQTFTFSPPFQLSDGRGAILAYVSSGPTAKVRSYHINVRTGLWHYAPDIIRGPRGEGMTQIGEAFGPMSTVLPTALQQVLSELVKTYGFREITTVNPDFLFAGTAMAYSTQQEYREALSRGQARGDFYQEVDHSPLLTNWQPSGRNKNAPQLISINADLAPNFQAPTVHFLTYSVLAGQVIANAFSSNDKQQIWLFCNDDLGRAWLGEIEIISPLTSTGCRRDWMNAGDMATPLYEYSTQSGNYGDPSDTRKGLIGMWNKYLSKIPVIQEYISWRSRTQQ